jgi:hypothetical protein
MVSLSPAPVITLQNGKWASTGDVSKYCSNHVQMTSKANFCFSVIEKASRSQIDAMEKETVHFELPGVEFDKVQVLLNSNKYLHVSDPIGDLASYFGSSKEAMVRAIQVRVKGQGFIPYLDPSFFTAVKLDSRYQQIDKVRVNRRPIIDVLNSSIRGWSYRSRNGAIMALFLHCISNVHLRHANHWSIDYLRNTKELIILLPLTMKQDTTAAVAAVYRCNTDNNLRLRQITNHCVVQPPMIISEDFNRVYQKRREGKK